MAPDTTQRTAALVIGPSWWGNRWQTRDGTPTPLTGDGTREARRLQAEHETLGLHEALDALPADCVLLLAGDSKAVHLAHGWADKRGRQVLVIPNIDPPSYWPLVKATALGLRDQGWLVKALVCRASEDDPVAVELRAAGLYVRGVIPVEPQREPDTEPATSGV